MRTQKIHKVDKSDELWEFVEIIGHNGMLEIADDVWYDNDDTMAEKIINCTDNMILISGLTSGHYVFQGIKPKELRGDLIDAAQHTSPEQKSRYLNNVCARVTSILSRAIANEDLAVVKDAIDRAWCELGNIMHVSEEHKLFV